MIDKAILIVAIVLFLWTVFGLIVASRIRAQTEERLTLATNSLAEAIVAEGEANEKLSTAMQVMNEACQMVELVCEMKGDGGGRARALSLVNQERNRQESLWGEQSHHPAVWIGILGEEYGELCQAVNETVFDNGPEERAKGGDANMMREACHVAAVAVSLMERLMRRASEESGADA